MKSMKIIKKIRFWHLLILAIVFGGLAAYSLRQNNLTMLQLKNDVFVADEKNGDVEAALEKLRNHVFSHMNTSLTTNAGSSEPPVQLIHRFNRAVAAEKARISAQSQEAATIYGQAQNNCVNPNVPLTSQAQCIQEYVAANGKDVPQLQLPPKEYYTFDYVSPYWTFDLAGISLLLAIFFFGAALIKFITGALIHLKLRSL